ncbi:MAG TPA: alpha/beta hydrolase [Steroidobacteraceae bacterium]|nr:alpha/beta hydrolase [Steroidobacteraceae bacterium]
MTTATARPNFGWKLRLVIAVQTWLVRLRIMPDADAYARWPVERRKALKPAPWMTYPPPASVQTKRETLATADGPLEMKLFSSGSVQAPSVLFIHGGGWVVGGVDSLDYLCANLCDRLNVGVAAVDYRLAPDHRFPAGLEDCYSALTWLATQAQRPILVVGDSAGGNLAAALCLLARDRGGPVIAHQTLIYPALDACMESPSMALEKTGMTRADCDAIVRHYLGDHDPRDPLVSPIHATDLGGLPPAFIVTADHDLLRDDGARYAECLRTAGVEVRYVNYPDMPHGFLSQPRLCAGAPAALADIIEEVRTRLVH